MRQWDHITYLLHQSTTSSLCLGVYNGLNHFVHFMPFIEKLHVGCSWPEKKKWTEFFIVKNENLKRGESAVILGKCLHFFSFRNTTFWWFYLILKTRSYGALSFIHVLQNTACKHGVPACKWALSSTWHMLDFISAAGAHLQRARSPLTLTSNTTAISSTVFSV